MLLKKIEKKRLINSKKKKIYGIKTNFLLRGDFIIVWYVSREKEKGIIKFQYIRGLCIDVRYKGYNSTFLLRTVMRNIVIERQFFFYSPNNFFIQLKKNFIRFYNKNKLSFLRKKKSKQSKYIL